MKTESGFSLLESLLAVVLMAVVVAMCVPFLSRPGLDARTSTSSDFNARANQLVWDVRSRQDERLSIQQYEEIATNEGWSCHVIPRIDAAPSSIPARGHWVCLSDGLDSVPFWSTADTGSESEP